MLGYALKVKEGVNPPATFTPKKVQLQVVPSKLVSGVTLSEQALQNRTAFCFTKITGAKDENVKFPKEDLKWSSNLFYDSVQGTFALTRSLFFFQKVSRSKAKQVQRTGDGSRERDIVSRHRS